MSQKEVIIDVKTKVNDSELKELNSKLKNAEDETINVKADTSEASDKLDNVKKKTDEVDGVSPTVKPKVDDNASDELEDIQKKSSDLDGQSPVIKPTVDDSEALSALTNIQNKIEDMGSLESGMAGILGSMGIEQMLGGGLETATNLDKAWRNWVGSLQQSGMAFDQARAKADQFKNTINKLASDGQSNDALFKNIAGLVINLNSQVSDSTLQMTEKVVAGYEMLGGRSGATLYEMEKELKDFLSTGSLGKMADTISSTADPEKWKGLLEGAKTAEERIEVLRQMLEEEGIMGALNIDAPSKSLDMLRAIFDASMTNIGTALISFIKPFADFFTMLDNMTGGTSTAILSVVAVVGLLSVVLLGFAGMVAPLIPVIAGLTIGFLNMIPGMLGVASAAVPTTAGLGGISAALLTASSALWAFLAPILPFIAIGAAIVAIIYLVGDALGWWGSPLEMGQALWTGLQRIMSAFANNPHVISFINTLKSAWSGLMQILSPIGDALSKFWASLFPNNSGANFDIVRAIIDIFGLLGDAIVGFLSATPIGLIITNLDKIGAAFQLLGNILSSIGRAISGAITNIGQVFLKIWSNVTEFFLSSFYDESGKWLGVIPGIINLLLNIGNAFRNGLLALPGLILSGLTILYNIGVRVGEAIWNALSQIPRIVIAAISALPGAIVSALTSLAGETANASSSIDWSSMIKGLIDFIISLPSQIVNLARSVLSGGIDLMTIIVGFLFGEQAGTNFSKNANVLLDKLFNPSEWINLILTGVNTVVSMILGLSPIQMIIDSIFGEGATVGLQTAITGFLTQLTTLPSQMFGFLSGVITYLLSWGTMIWNLAIVIASTFVTNIIMWVSQLPGRVWNWLVSAAGRISAFGGTALARATQIGQNILTGIVNKVKQIPGMVYNELVRVGERIMSAGGALYQKAVSVGQGIWQSMKNGLGIGSPGHIYWMISDEFDRVTNLMEGIAKPWFDKAKNMGINVVDGFGEPKLSVITDMVDNIELNPLKVKIIADTTDFLRDILSDKLYPLSDVNLGGTSSVSEDVSNYKIEYSTPTTPNITINSVVTTQEQIDTIRDIVQKGNAQDDLRVKL